MKVQVYVSGVHKYVVDPCMCVQVLDLLIVVLHQTHKEAEDRWRKLSRQITDQLLPLLDTQQVGALYFVMGVYLQRITLFITYSYYGFYIKIGLF